MSLNAQKVIDEGLKGILSALLEKVPWDPSFDSSHATAASDFDKAIGVCEAVIKSAMLYATKLCRRKNEEFASTKQLPLELLIRVWKEAVPRDADYYKALGPIRLTSTRWAEIIDNDPSFWTVLSCGTSWEQAERSLARSAELPLDVYFPCRDSYPVDFKDEEWTEWGHGHQRFLETLRPELHRVRSAHISPHFSDWEELQEFFAEGASKVSRLDIDGDKPGAGQSLDRQFVLRNDFLEGVAPALRSLHLANCDIHSRASYPFHFPVLYALKITKTVLSASQARRFLAASPALAELTLEDCKVKECANAPTSILQTQLRRVCIQGNVVVVRYWDPFRGIGLANIVDYISTPCLESFHVRQEYRVEVEIRSLGDWVAAFSERYPATWMGLEIGLTIAFSYGEQFYAQVFTPDSTATYTLALAILDNIHPSKLPLITWANFQINDSVLHTLFPDLASRLPSITHIVLHGHIPLSWAVLGRPGTPNFPRLVILEQWGLRSESEGELLDLLRVRRSPAGEPNGWRALEAVHMVDGTANKSLVDSARALGIDVQTNSLRIVESCD